MAQTDTQGRCEVLGETPTLDDRCGIPAMYRYPARGGGYMRLCATHATLHLRYCERWDDLTKRWIPSTPTGAPHDAR